MVNPGLLLGSYLPIYGFGLVVLTVIYLLFKDSNLNPIIIMLLMGLLMTLIELIGGIIGLKNNIRLWALYYLFLSPYIMHALNWFSKNPAFSYTLWIFTGVIIIDLFYSRKLSNKIKKFAKENSITVKYEQLKMSIKDTQAKRKEKYQCY